MQYAGNLHTLTLRFQGKVQPKHNDLGAKEEYARRKINLTRSVYGPDKFLACIPATRNLPRSERRRSPTEGPFEQKFARQAISGDLAAAI